MNNITDTSLPRIGDPFRSVSVSVAGGRDAFQGPVQSLRMAGVAGMGAPALASSRPYRGTSAIADLMHGIRKLLASDPDAATDRPMRDADRWSDQAEVSFYEERRAPFLGP